MLLKFTVLTAKGVGLTGSSLAASPPPWNYTGWERFPAFYFGAKEGNTGVQSAAELAFIGRHALGGWGWQQRHGLGHHGEEAGLRAAAALRAAVGSHVGSTPDALFVYRQSEGLFSYYDLMAAVAANTTLDTAATLRDPYTRLPCAGGGLLGFNNATFVKYWAETVGGEIAREPQVDAVFFDGFDKLYSGSALSSTSNCSGFALRNNTAIALQSKLHATLLQTQVLNRGGRVPILSSYNYFSQSALSMWSRSDGKHSVHSHSMNGISEDSYASMLAGHSWIRFYEVWLGHGESQDAAQISNAVLETSVGIPFIARAAVGKTGDSQPDTDAVFYAACAFLVAQGPYCYFGASSGWLDQDWQWHSPYDWKIGKPLGHARRLSLDGAGSRKTEKPAKSSWPPIDSRFSVQLGGV